MIQPPDLLWVQPDWREQAHAWIHAQLERLGMRAEGPIEQPHVRVWSTVLRVPTREGALFFKANAPVFAHEAALVAAWTRWGCDHIPRVLAADTQRGWILMADGGETLRSVVQEDGDIRHWHRLLPLYARLQISMAEHVPDLLSLGLPDSRLSALPAQYARLLDDTEILRIGQPEGLSAEEYMRLRDLTPQLAADCARLAAYGISETMQHDDLHDNNILVRDERYLFFDWGDSCVAHPYFSMLVIMRSAARTLNREEDDPAILELRDIYLKSWTHLLPSADLRAAFTLAYRLGMICRTLTYYRLVSNLEGSSKEEYVPHVAGWLQEFLYTTPKGITE